MGKFKISGGYKKAPSIKKGKMKAIDWPDSNVKFAENQDEYKTLPALRLGGDDDIVITKYKLNIIERIRVLFLGVVWMSEMNFNRPLTPRYLSTRRKDMYLKSSE